MARNPIRRTGRKTRKSKRFTRKRTVKKKAFKRAKNARRNFQITTKKRIVGRVMGPELKYNDYTQPTLDLPQFGNDPPIALPPAFQIWNVPFSRGVLPTEFIGRQIKICGFEIQYKVQINMQAFTITGL